MARQHTEIIAFKVDEQTKLAIVNLLNQYSRDTYPTTSDLLRDLLEIGLKRHWDKLNRENAK
jgi:hypothetical protein